MLPAIHARAFSWLDSFNIAASITIEQSNAAQGPTNSPQGSDRDQVPAMESGVWI
jgi:hypothetical protein